jgi:competence protein ComEC
LRSRMTAQVGSSLPEPYASLALGLVTGVNDAFDTEFKEQLRTTGTTHIVAVSGYNLTIVALLLRRWGNRRSRWLGLGLAVGGIVFYVLLAGANPSIMRGAVVAGLALLIATSGRVIHRSALLIMGAVVLTLLWPLGPLYNLSWQLSFLAFAGILFAAPLFKNILRRRLKGVGEALGETLGAEIMVLPLILYQFGVISVVSPVVNVIVLAVTPLAMAMSAVQAFASLLYLPFGRVMAWVTYPILWSIVKPIEWGSKIPFADFEISRIPLPYFLGSYIVVVGILYGIRKLELSYAATT